MRVSFGIEGGIALIKSVYCFDALCHDMMVTGVENETHGKRVDVVSHDSQLEMNLFQLKFLKTLRNHSITRPSLCILGFRFHPTDSFSSIQTSNENPRRVVEPRLVN